MSSLYAPLEDDLLYMFVFGPGFGETVLIRIPPNTWIVVDSFRSRDIAAANLVLDHFLARASLVVLTHPHKDHVLGFIDLLENSTDALIGALLPNDDGVLNKPNDGIASLFGNEAIRTFERIHREWQNNSAKKWQTSRGAEYQIPNGKIISLHPAIPTSIAQWQRSSLNDLSSAMLVEWYDARIVLGADVTDENASWDEITEVYRNLAAHSTLKVPHHGSEKAINDKYAAGDPKRCWIVTPYNLGRKLPRFEPGQGVDLALNFVDEVNLTALPIRHDFEASAPFVTTRGVIDAGLPVGGEDDFDPMERGIAIGFNADGSIAKRRYGKGTLRITQ
jgi:hypothetical protein